MASSSALPERDTLTQRGAKTSSVGDSTNSNLVSNNHADLDLNPRAGTLADLQPDFVLSVLYSNDNGTVTAAATADFERLLTTLDGLGFQFQVKPGSAQTVLVFIRLAPQALHAAVAAARTHDLAAGVASFTYPAEPSASERLRVARGLITAAGITPGVGNWNFVRCLTALHDTAANYRVLVGWAHGARAFFSATDAQCEHVRDAYGPALALYFYFARHFITWLGPLALVGAANHLLVGRYSPLFALTTLVWSVAFYHSWRQRSQNLTARWGIIGNDATPLPASPSTLADSTSFSDVAVRQLAIVPLALSVTFILFSYQLLCFATEIFLTQVYAGPLQRYLSLIPTGMIVVFVPVLNLFYGKVIDAVCGWEGHTTVEGLRASKAHKQFVVTFLTSYVPLLLSAFLYLPFAHHVGAHLASAQRLVPTLLSTRLGVSITPQFTVNAARLATQYHYFLFTNNVVGFATSFFLPIVVRHALPKAKTLASGEPAVFDDGVDAEYLADVRAQIELRAYDVSEDYTQTVVQFGYLVMYAPVWSLSPLFVLVFALFQFKGDLFKVMTQVRRPLPERVVSSAPYDSYVILLAWVGSITSTAITAMYRVPPKVAYAQPFTANEHTSLYTRGAANVGIAPWKLALVVFAVEHVFFGLNVFFRAVYAHFRPQDAVDLERRVTVARAEFVQAHKRDLVHENVDDSSLDSSWLSAADAAAAAKVIPRQVVVSSEGKSFPLQKGDKIIDSRDASGSAVASIDANTHFNPKTDLSEQAKGFVVVEAKGTANPKVVASDAGSLDDSSRVEAKQPSSAPKTFVVEAPTDISEEIVVTSDAKGNEMLSTIDDNTHVQSNLSDISDSLPFDPKHPAINPIDPAHDPLVRDATSSSKAVGKLPAKDSSVKKSTTPSPAPGSSDSHSSGSSSSKKTKLKGLFSSKK